ncbi:hypothetical protein ACWGI9_39895 [Streptomyces sp. NPDC054833]
MTTPPPRPTSRPWPETPLAHGMQGTGRTRTDDTDDPDDPDDKEGAA